MKAMANSRFQQKNDNEVSGLNRGYGLLLLILNLAVAGIFWWQLPPQIPLFYSLPYGVSQLAERGWFGLLPGLAVGLYGTGQLMMKIPVKSTLYAPLVGWLQTLGLFLIMLAMIHIIMVVL